MKNSSLNIPELIHELQKQQGDFCVSLCLPAASHMPQKLQDRIRLKDLIAKAEKQLRAQHPERDFKAVVERIEKLVENFDFDADAKAIALFVSETFGKIVRLPFTVSEPSVTVDTQFNISFLMRQQARSTHYLILELTKKMCRLYEAHDTALEEIETPLTDSLGNPLQGFPLDYVEPSDTAQMAEGSGERGASYPDNQIKHYFSMVDAELGKVLATKKLPVIVCGAEKNLSIFRECTKHATAIMGYQTGDFKNKLEIAQAVAHILHERQTTEKEALITRFKEAEGVLHQAFGIRRVWQMAVQGRIEILLVEEGLHIPGIVDAQQQDHLILQEIVGGKQLHNLVDTVIEKVLHTKGKVVFVAPGTLQDFEQIGAILRY